MTKNDVAALRLANQQVSTWKFKSPQALTGWMGAMQAQDFRMVRWAIGLRLPGSHLKDIDKAINDGRIIRTHLLRPTWHFVSADDLQWMLALSAPRIKPALKYRQDFLGLTPEILSYSNTILSEILKGKNLGREEIKNVLNKEGIITENNSLSHILFWAELSGIICSGKIVNDKQTYSLLQERVLHRKHYEKNEALGMLASKYFKSHGPATVKDFIWWSGLSTSDIKIAVEAADGLQSGEIDSVKYLFGKEQQASDDSGKQAWLIPAYDEMLISYTDRSAVLSKDGHGRTVSSNGIFRPVVIIKNQVAGLWKTARSKERIIVEISPFRKLTRSDKTGISNAADAYGNFIGFQAEVKYNLS